MPHGQRGSLSKIFLSILNIPLPSVKYGHLFHILRSGPLLNRPFSQVRTTPKWRTDQPRRGLPWPVDTCNAWTSGKRRLVQMPRTRRKKGKSMMRHRLFPLAAVALLMVTSFSQSVLAQIVERAIPGDPVSITGGLVAGNLLPGRVKA